MQQRIVDTAVASHRAFKSPASSLWALPDGHMSHRNAVHLLARGCWDKSRIRRDQTTHFDISSG